MMHKHHCAPRRPYGATDGIVTEFVRSPLHRYVYSKEMNTPTRMKVRKRMTKIKARYCHPLVHPMLSLTMESSS